MVLVFMLNQRLTFLHASTFNVEIVEDTGCALHSAVSIGFGVN